MSKTNNDYTLDFILDLVQNIQISNQLFLYMTQAAFCFISLILHFTGHSFISEIIFPSSGYTNQQNITSTYYSILKGKRD